MEHTKLRCISALPLITLLTLTYFGYGARLPAQLLQTPHTAPAVPNDPLVAKFREVKQLTSETWERVDTIELKHPVYHPQGMVKIGNNFFISAAEILECTEKFSDPPEGQPDRTKGRGTGHFFKFDRNGALVHKVTLGEKEIYHPGGIDYDGENIWVSVAEYRPHSQSIIYKVNPETLEYEVVFRVRAHIGGVVFDPLKRVLHGVSWGSRDFYTWSPPGEREQLNRRANGSYYVDYQDCQFVPARFMLCSGMKEYSPPGVGTFAFGGLELVDLASQTPIHQVPVLLYPDEKDLKVVLTRNPMFAELEGDSIRFYFLPADSLPSGEKPACSEESVPTSSSIYVYRVRAQ